jgi:N-acetylmuramic acid 6-phosphate etherase
MGMNIELKGLTTETRNENSRNIDTMTTLDMVKTINNEDKLIAQAVEKQLPNIAKAVDIIADRLKMGAD